MNNLTLGYEKKEIVIKDISFSVNDKDFIIITGKNGTTGGGLGTCWNELSRFLPFSILFSA